MCVFLRVQTDGEGLADLTKCKVFCFFLSPQKQLPKRANITKNETRSTCPSNSIVSTGSVSVSLLFLLHSGSKDQIETKKEIRVEQQTCIQSDDYDKRGTTIPHVSLLHLAQSMVEMV